MDNYESEIRARIKEAIDQDVIIELEVPKNQVLGDFAYPCFLLAKSLKKSPQEIAAQLAAKIKPSGNIISVNAAGPYLNFKINKLGMITSELKKILEEMDDYGSSRIGLRKKALIEHTSVNPNASPHVGRARNAMIGDCIARLLKFQKFETEVHYLVNDVGKQIAMLVIGCRGRPDITFKDLLEIYIDISRQAEENPEIEKEIFSLLARIESGDDAVRKDFERVVSVCIEGQKKIFHGFGIEYDSFDHESQYLWGRRTHEILELLKNTGKLFIDEEGRNVLSLQGSDIPMENPVLVLTRADGTSLYPLRDIAYHIDKINKAEHNYVVLGEDHKLYYMQLSAALLLLGYRPPRVIHYSFILLNEGKMSTRKGNVVLLEEFMAQAKEKARAEIEKRHGIVDNIERLSEIIGYGAVKYSILRVSPEKNVTFDWETSLSFEGDSGPYIQYSHARICSILQKHGMPANIDADFSKLTQNEEIALATRLAAFPAVLEKALDDLRPNAIANYANEVAQRFNEFYHNCPILQSEKNLLDARLALAVATKQVLRNALHILGIEAPAKM